jgi:predicted branched-subunit amino acid permease
MTTTTAPSTRSAGADRRTTCPAPVARAAPPWRMAAADTLTVSSGMISFGLVLGITIDALGRDRLAGVIGAAAVYGGSAQLTTVTLLAQGSALALAVLSGFVVNLRLLLYSAAMGDRFAGQPRLFRWLAPFLMIDQTFLMAEGRRELPAEVFRRYWLCLGGYVAVVWTSSVAAGELLAPALPPLPHLTLVCTAMFLGLLLPRLVSRPAVVAAVAGGLTAGVVSELLPALGIVAGAVAGVTAACALHDPSTRS